MTKFDNVAVTSRVKQRSTFTASELRKNMQEYKETGVHPVLAAQADADAVAALPTRDLNRPHCFMEFTIDGKPAGKLVFELFQDQAPQAVGHLRYRCAPGTSESFQGDTAHRIISGVAIIGGHSTAKSGAGAGKVVLPRSKALRCTEPGCLMISPDGASYVVSLGRALQLDVEYQVVGRATPGAEGEACLSALREVYSDRLDNPSSKVVVSRCGPCSYMGEAGSLETGPMSAAAMGPEALKKLAEETRGAVAGAVAAGLKRKEGPSGRKEPEADSKEAPAAKRTKGLFDAVLGDISSDSDSDSESEGKEEGKGT